MLKCTIFLSFCLLVQAKAPEIVTGSNQLRFLSYMRYPRRAQTAYDVDPPRRSYPVYGVTPPRRSQSAFDVDPSRRSYPVYGVTPSRRSQSPYDVDPLRRSYPVYTPSRRSQSAYDVNPPRRSQSAYEFELPNRSEFADGEPISQEFVLNSRIRQKQAPNVGSKSYDQDNGPANVQPVAQKLPSAYWVEPYRSNAKAPLADDIAEGNQGVYNPASQSRTGSNENDRLNEPDCILPPLPEHANTTTLRLGLDIVILNVTCDPGYILHGAASVHCYNGFWADDMPTCLPVTCPLKKHHSVEYRCLVVGDVVGSRECQEEEPVGTIVSPLCRKPHFYSTSNNLAFMHCGEDGSWDHLAKCTPECGTVTANGHGLVVDGKNAKRGELPWHVGVYMKRFTPYKQICGGSLISNKLIISAAHCFWNDIERQLPASDFAVAVGKLYRPYNDKMDDSQKSDVKEIHIPPRFQGASSNYQDDIAVVIPAEAFEFKIHVRPICLSFDSHFDRLQLQTINKGKVAGWGLTAPDGKPSPVLQVLELPYVEVGICIKDSPPTFTAHITSDKICAGDQNTSMALCHGDSGGGLAFAATDRDTSRYYLRGVVSTAPGDEHDCNVHTYTGFTHVKKHEDFIKQFITED